LGCVLVSKGETHRAEHQAAAEREVVEAALRGQ
jgi:hypothetical protein